MEHPPKKHESRGYLHPLLALALALAVGLFMGMMLGWMGVRRERGLPPAGRAAARDDGRDAAVRAPVDDGDCVPVLVSDDTREADVLATMVDKALLVNAKATTTDGGFTVDASASVADLNMVFNPPLHVPAGTPTPVPQPTWTKAQARPSGRITCEARAGGACVPVVETPVGDRWDAANGPAGIAVRAEHEDLRANEVRVSFRTEAAIDGGVVAGTGLFLVPPSGSITYTNGKKTLSPALGSARWRCDRVL